MAATGRRGTSEGGSNRLVDAHLVAAHMGTVRGLVIEVLYRE